MTDKNWVTALSSVRFNDVGLVPAVVQSIDSKRVLMVAWMNAESLAKSIEIGETVFFSRSRSELWHKGATSGNRQQIASIQVDCDGDTLLVMVRETGPACHTGSDSCFDTATIFEEEAEAN